MSENVLEPSLIKDLSNHIYEKRKATAFQIEGLTKSAVQRDDIQTVHKIIAELTELTNGGSTLARMGAITALGSVSVALGSFAIAYFLQSIIQPIFATFKDTDARVRYYACESLYNIAKIARGEILLYFNEIFDILCILVTDTESLVKNAADILDRLIKDIVSAKSTNYVSILHQNTESEIPSHITNASGMTVQVNEVQDVKKAFSLPKFIPTLLERINSIDPFAKKFLIGWLELFDDIPSLELITFLPNFLEPLIKFLMNGCPSDVRVETQNLLDTFLKEIKSIFKVKFEIKKKHLTEDIEPSGIAGELEGVQLEAKETESIESETNDTVVHHSDAASENGSLYLGGQDIFIDLPRVIDILLSFLRIPDVDADVKANDLSAESHDIYLEVQITVLKWLQEILEMSPTSFVKFLPNCVSTILKSIAITDGNKDYDLRNQFNQFNFSVQDFIIKLHETAGIVPTIAADIDDNMVRGLNKEVYEEFLEFYLTKTLRQIMSECLSCNNVFARLTSLDWLMFLYSKMPNDFFKAMDDMDENFDLTALLRSATESSNEVVLKVLQLISQISETNEEFFKGFMVNLVHFFEEEGRGDARQLLPRSKIEFIIRRLCVSLSPETIYQALSEVLTSHEEGKLEFLNMMVVTLNNILLTSQEHFSFRKKLKNLDVYKLEDWDLFATLFQFWCHSPASALSLCLLTSNYELAYLIIKSLAELEVTFQLLTQLDVLVQLLETPIFLKLRLQLLEPEKNPHLYKTLLGILMILPQSSTFNTLRNRLSCLSTGNNVSNSSVLSSTPVSTPGASAGGANSQLSIKKKRIYEMASTFSKIQEEHEQYISEKKLMETFEGGSRSSGYRNDRMLSVNNSTYSKDFFDDRKRSTSKQIR